MTDITGNAMPAGQTGGSLPNTSFGSVVFGGSGQAPQRVLQAPNITNDNAAAESPYTFTLTFRDSIPIPQLFVYNATVLVVPPSGSNITATSPTSRSRGPTMASATPRSSPRPISSSRPPATGELHLTACTPCN